MKIAAILSGALAACATPPQLPIDARGFEALGVQAGRLEIRVSYFGGVDDCPSCVLVETVDGVERNARYVERLPNCWLRPPDVQGHVVKRDGVRATLHLQLEETGHRAIRRCLSASREDDDLASFIATVDGQPIGEGLLFKKMNILTIRGFGGIGPALSVLGLGRGPAPRKL